MITRDEEPKYATLGYDLKSGSGKGFAKYLEAAKEAAKAAPRRPLEEVLNTTFTSVGPIKVAVVTITPDVAWELLLKHNIRNRPISYSHAVRLALEIIAGRWMLVHTGGAFNTKGDIEDQQHRLVAVILADMPIQMVMVADLANDLFKAIDIGKVRSAGSALELAGHNGSSTLLGQIIMQLAIPYDEENVLYYRDSGEKKRSIGRGEMIEYTDDHPDLVDAAHDALDLHATALAAIGDKAAGVFAYWKIREAFGQEAADEFMEELADEGHSDKHPISLLQARINKHKLGKRAGRDQPAHKNVLTRDRITWLLAACFRVMRSKNHRNFQLVPRGDDPFPRFEDSVAPPAPAADKTPPVEEPAMV